MNRDPWDRGTGRALLAGGGLVILVCVALASSAQGELYSARTTLVFSEAGGSEEDYTWAVREARRIEDQGALLIAPAVGSSAVEDIRTSVANNHLAIEVLASCRQCTVDGALAALEVAAADLARRDDPDLHRDLREAELRLGLPSPPNPARPHDSDDTPSPVPSLDPTALDTLVSLRHESTMALPEWGLEPISGPTEVQPRVVEDMAEGGLALLVIGGTVVLGPAWWLTRLLRRCDRPLVAVPTGRPGTGAAVAAVLVLASGLVAATPRVGRIAPVLFVGFSGLAAVVLRRDRTEVVSFVLFLWLLAGLAGRLMAWQVDIDAGSTAAAAVVAGLVVAILVWRAGLRLDDIHPVMVWLPVPVAMAVGIGLIEAGPLAVAIGAASWLAPTAVAIAALHGGWREAVVDAVRRWFLLGSVVVAVYGLVQYTILPSWDAAWLGHASVTSFGRPRAFDIRVLSTLSSPASLGLFSAMALVFSAAAREVHHRWIYLVASSVALALSLHRTSWLAAVIGLLAVAATADPRHRNRPRDWLLGLVGIGLVVSVVPSVRERVVDTWRGGLADGSLSERLTTHRTVVLDLITDPVGQGFGATGPAARVAGDFVRGYDSTILDGLATFGGPLGLLVVGGFLLLTWRSGHRLRHTEEGRVGFVLAVVVIVATPFVNVLEESQGAVTWSAIALLMAATVGERDRESVL